jgi:hypothetical protein
MEPVTSIVLQQFLKKLGEQFPHPIKFYLLGGSALCLLGSPRETLDVDYSMEPPSPEIEQILRQLSSEFHLDLESVPLAEFIPLPPNAEKRHRFLGRYGQVDVYIYDLYSIALSKISRGFESDLEDVEFLLARNLIKWDELEKYFKDILPRAKTADIDSKEFESYFNTLKKHLSKQ